MVVLSDGHDTQRAIDPAVLEPLRHSRWVVMTVPVGAPQSWPDLAVTAWAEADFVHEGQSTWIHARVTATGIADPTVRVDLLDGQQLVESRQVTFQGQPSVATRFRVTPATAQGEAQTIHAYRVAVRRVAPEPRPSPAASTSRQGHANEIDDEPFQGNNSRWVFVRVSNDRIRVTLLEGQPYWDTRFLARALQDDPQIDLTAVFSLGRGRTTSVQTSSGHRVNHPASSLDPTVIDAAWLNRFDVVILGRHAEAFFPGHRAELLADYVIQRGGKLILARGQAFAGDRASGREAQEVMAALSPVQWGDQVVSGLRLAVTGAGRIDPLTGSHGLLEDETVLTQLPDMLAATRIDRHKAASVVLLDQIPYEAGDAMAAVAHMNVGRGRVFAVLTDGLWRWAFLPSRNRSYDSVYGLFWARAVRWLVGGGEFLPGEPVSLQLNRLAVHPDEPLEISVTMRDVAAKDITPRLTLTDPHGHATPVGLVRSYEQSPRLVATVRPSAPGVHQLDLTTEGDGSGSMKTSVSRRFAVYERSVEKLDPSARPEVLGTISEATGGRCWGLDETRELLDYLDSIEQAHKNDPIFQYRLNAPAVIGAVFVLLGLEWWLRRRVGLV